MGRLHAARLSIATSLGLSSLLAVVAVRAQTAETPPDAAPEGEAQAIVVVVQGQSQGQREMRSGRAVSVVELAEAKGEASDLGDVLGRVSGVSVRRQGGLGSEARLSLNGLGGDRVSFFLDGIPLDRTGHSLGLGNVPLGLLERVEIYRGVTPIRLGADALGGAVNLVTDHKTSGTRSTASLQLGSFGQRRAAASLRHRAPQGHLFFRGSAFLDSAKNNYSALVDSVDEQGRVNPTRLPRFHDGYRAYGLDLQAGLVQLPWARRLLLSAFATQHDREIQHNQLMTVPYGEVQYGKRSTGGHLSYSNRLATGLYLDFLAGNSNERTLFQDQSACRYNWQGQCVVELPQRGEVSPVARDQLIDTTTWYARLGLTTLVGENHQLRASLAPEWLGRTGRDKEIAPGSFDALRARRSLFALTTGLEWEAQVWDDELRNIAFAKFYSQRASTVERLPSGRTRNWALNTLRLGLGDSLRWDLSPATYLHASYELATRLPEPDQLFGDGLLTVENLELQPESSHNFNLGLRADAYELPYGNWNAGLSGFARLVDDMQVLVGGASYQQYDNIGAARALGVALSSDWSAPGGWFNVAANGTWQRVRNVSNTGVYEQFNGEPLPNQPQASADLSVRLAGNGWLQSRDRLSVHANGHFVQEFYRGWQSAGRNDTKLIIPDQWLFTAGVGYAFSMAGLSASTSLAAHNLGDSAAFDYFGVQRPGRSFHFKLTVESGRKDPSS